jgi:hypothetical protein
MTDRKFADKNSRGNDSMSQIQSKDSENDIDDSAHNSFPFPNNFQNLSSGALGVNVCPPFHDSP